MNDADAEGREAAGESHERADQGRPDEPAAAGIPGTRARIAALAAAAIVICMVVARSLAGEPELAVASFRGLLPVGEAARSFLRSTGLEGAWASVVAVGAAPAALAARDEPQSAVSRRIRHEGHVGIDGGVVFAPDTFSTADGAYDLLLHFHGNTRAVRESAEVAGLDAVVAVVNLGVGSAPYHEAYAVPGSYEALLDQIGRAVAQRGVRDPRLRRVALSSWSAGYGAISTILDVRRGRDPLDAILVLDGIHTSFVEEQPGTLDALKLQPFVRAARDAAGGAFLFSITHSQIDPIAYAGAADTAKFLLDAVGVRAAAPASSLEALPRVSLRSAVGAVAKRLEKRMEPITDTRLGELHVRGFRGNTPEHHMAHLLQMGATVLPELRERWKAR